MSDAQLTAFRLAQYILNNQGVLPPSLQEMKDVVDQEDNITNVKERIKDLEKKHCNDLERLYQWQAQDYQNEAEDMRVAKDDSQYLVQGENNPTIVSSYAKLDSLYKASRKGHVYQREWDGQLFYLRTAYLKQLFPLQRLLAKLEIQDAEARRKEFPGSVREYRAIQNNDVKFRVAKFLALRDVKAQEQMMAEFGWAWRQVQPLKNEYEKNGDFMVDIELAVRDPTRRKR